MSDRTLRTFDDPALSTVCEPVKSGDDLSFLGNMRAVCKAHNGAGLAAPQIGVLKRAIYVCPPNGDTMFLLNPTIIDRSPAMTTENEGCLSYPGTWTPVERHLAVTVEYADEDFIIRRGQFVYFAARVVQHECDHLLGVCKVGDAWRADAGKRSAGRAALAVIGAMTSIGAMKAHRQ